MAGESNEELAFDDNGLENASQQTFWREIFTSNRNFGNVEKGPQLSHFDAFPPERDETQSAEIAIDETKSYCKELLEDDIGGRNPNRGHSRASGATGDQDKPPDQTVSEKRRDQQENIGILDCHKIKKRGAENVHDRSTIKLKEAEVKEKSVLSAGSPKHGSDYKSNTGLEIQDTDEKVDDRGPILVEEKETKKLKVWSGCFIESHTKLEILSSLATFYVASFSLISLKCTISVTVGLLLLMPSVGVEGALTSAPANTLFVVGQTARMKCSTNLSQPVFWARSPVGSNVQHWLYYGKNGFNGNNADGRFAIDKDEATGRYDVIIEDVQPKDSGQYICVDNSGIGVKASAELVVSDPIKCKARIPTDGVMGYNVFGLQQDVLQISCSVNYTGNVLPTLKWSWHGSEMESDQPLVSLSKSSVISTLNLSPTKERNNAKFQCRANVEGATQNKVDDGLYWESETISIRYAEFASEEVETCPDVQLNLLCNPPCSYYFESKEGDCQCLYTYNDARTQQKYNITSDAVNCGKGKDISPNIVIAVVVVATFVIAAVIGLVCFLMRKNTKKCPIYGSKESGTMHNYDNSSKAMLPEFKALQQPLAQTSMA